MSSFTINAAAMNNTPITVSDVSTGITIQSQSNPISIHSNSINDSAGISVSWKKSFENVSTPSGVEKVQNWIGQQNFDSNKSTDEGNDSILLRFDFDKDSVLLNEKNDMPSPKRKTLLSNGKCETKSTKLIDLKTSLNVSNGASDRNGNADVQKNELYNYLQLMNPKDKIDTAINNTRRFTRANCSSSENLTMKSFKDLNFEDHNFWCRNTFNFRMPPPNVLNNFCDFERHLKTIVKLKDFKRSKSLSNAIPKRNKKKKDDKIIEEESVGVDESHVLPSDYQIATFLQSPFDKTKVDLLSFVEDINDFNKMSEQHKKYIMETRIVPPSSSLFQTDDSNKLSNNEHPVDVISYKDVRQNNKEGGEFVANTYISVGERRNTQNIENDSMNVNRNVDTTPRTNRKNCLKAKSPRSETSFKDTLNVNSNKMKKISNVSKKKVQKLKNHKASQSVFRIKKRLSSRKKVQRTNLDINRLRNMKKKKKKMNSINKTNKKLNRKNFETIVSEKRNGLVEGDDNENATFIGKLNCEVIYERDQRRISEEKTPSKNCLENISPIAKQVSFASGVVRENGNVPKDISSKGIEISKGSKNKLQASNQEKQAVKFQSDSLPNENSLPKISTDNQIGTKNVAAKENMSECPLSPPDCKLQPISENVERKSLHQNLMPKKSKSFCDIQTSTPYNDWELDGGKSPKVETKSKNQHSIRIESSNGVIISAIYLNFNLIIVQETAVSMWNQTALGNMMGTQHLWIFYGCSKKLVLNKECLQKKSTEMAISMDSTVAYIELWTQEHKSNIRQRPVADVFATIYFWVQKLNKVDKKALQLENINCFVDDVQYVVMKSSLNIVVSWHSSLEDTSQTTVRLYEFAPTFQKVTNIKEVALIEHYISSLHNIQDCDNLVVGCGEEKITILNVEHGYAVATICLMDIKPSLSTLWVKCDRGILFTIQQCVDEELRLIAINGRNQSWKRLKSFKPPETYNRIQGAYIEKGILVSFYEEGIICWKVNNGEQVFEENDCGDYFSTGKYIVSMLDNQVFVKHTLSYLLTAD